MESSIIVLLLLLSLSDNTFNKYWYGFTQLLTGTLMKKSWKKRLFSLTHLHLVSYGCHCTINCLPLPILLPVTVQLGS